MPYPPARAEEVDQPDCCPHVNLNDARCSSRFRIGRLDQALAVCFGAYRGCPTYHRINAEKRAHQHVAGPVLAVVAFTASGKGVGIRPADS